MFAVVFTFAVMGIIGFSLYQPDEKVIQDSKATTTQSALTASDDALSGDQNAQANEALQRVQPVIVE